MRLATTWGEERGDDIVKNCGHLKNMRLYHQHASRSILKQVHCPMGGAHWKMVEMKTLFHTFTHGYLLLEYKSLSELFVSLQVPKNPTMY